MSHHLARRAGLLVGGRGEREVRGGGRGGHADDAPATGAIGRLGRRHVAVGERVVDELLLLRVLRSQRVSVALHLVGL